MENISLPVTSLWNVGSRWMRMKRELLIRSNQAGVCKLHLENKNFTETRLFYSVRRECFKIYQNSGDEGEETIETVVVVIEQTQVFKMGETRIRYFHSPREASYEQERKYESDYNTVSIQSTGKIQGRIKLALASSECDTIVMETVKNEMVVTLRLISLNFMCINSTFFISYSSVTRLEIGCAVSMPWMFRYLPHMRNLTVIRFGRTSMNQDNSDQESISLPDRFEPNQKVQLLEISYDVPEYQKMDEHKQSLIECKIKSVLRNAPMIFPALREACMVIPKRIESDLDTFLYHFPNILTNGEKRTKYADSLVSFNSTSRSAARRISEQEHRQWNGVMPDDSKQYNSVKPSVVSTISPLSPQRRPSDEHFQNKANVTGDEIDDSSAGFADRSVVLVGSPSPSGIPDHVPHYIENDHSHNYHHRDFERISYKRHRMNPPNKLPPYSYEYDYEGRSRPCDTLTSSPPARRNHRNSSPEYTRPPREYAGYNGSKKDVWSRIGKRVRGGMNRGSRVAGGFRGGRGGWNSRFDKFKRREPSWASESQDFTRGQGRVCSSTSGYEDHWDHDNDDWSSRAETPQCPTHEPPELSSVQQSSIDSDWD